MNIFLGKPINLSKATNILKIDFSNENEKNYLQAISDINKQMVKEMIEIDEKAYLLREELKNKTYY